MWPFQVFGKIVKIGKKSTFWVFQIFHTFFKFILFFRGLPPFFIFEYKNVNYYERCDMSHMLTSYVEVCLQRPQRYHVLHKNGPN